VLQGYLWRARSINCTSEQIIIVNGSQQGLDLCARLFLDTGDKFIIENPSYLLAKQAFTAVGGIPLPIDVDDDGLKTEGLPSARLSYVTPSHQYPLGSVLSATRRRQLVSWAQREGAHIIEDDYDSEYRDGIAPIPSLQSLAPEHVVYVGTLSKTLSPEMRLGYIVVPLSLTSAFCAAKRLSDRHTSLILQDTLCDMIESGAYERHVRSIRRRNSERKTVLLKILNESLGSKVKITGSDSGLHILLWIQDLPAYNEPEVVAAARARGIGLYPVSPLFAFSTERASSAGFILGYAGLPLATLAKGAVLLSEIIEDIIHRLGTVVESAS
jgi:GntR family transcriptional regulator / MocR family aminotransferase